MSESSIGGLEAMGSTVAHPPNKQDEKKQGIMQSPHQHFGEGGKYLSAGRIYIAPRKQVLTGVRVFRDTPVPSRRPVAIIFPEKSLAPDTLRLLYMPLAIISTRLTSANRDMYSDIQIFRR